MMNATPNGPFGRLLDAYRHRLAGVPEARPEGPVVGYVGTDVPSEVFDAAGLRAVRISGGEPGAPTPMADQVAEAAIDPLARCQLERLLDGTYAGLAAVFVSHDTEAAARLFHYASECRHLGIGSVPPVHIVDIGHLPTEASRRHSVAVVAEFVEQVGFLIGRPVTEAELRSAIARSNERRHLLAQVAALRSSDQPRLSGVQALAVIGAAATLSADEHINLLSQFLAEADDWTPLEGERVVVTGSTHEDPERYRELEAKGALVVAEDHDWGQAWFHGLIDAELPPVEALAASRHGGAPRTGRHPIAARAQHLADLAAEVRAERVVAFLRPGDEGPPWDLPAQRRLLADVGIPLTLAPAQPPESPLGRADRGQDANRAPKVVRGSGDGRVVEGRGASATPKREKGLEASRAATTFQREWFAAMRDQVAAGSPLAMVNADAPHEILRAMGIPYVVNQWWASVCAAKQQGPRYLGLLRDLGYPDDIEAYSAMALGSALAEPSADDPWGGLPPVDLLVAETTTDATAKIFETWSAETGAELSLLEATVAPLVPRRWFDHVHNDWENAFGTRRIDLMVAEINNLIGQVERRTGRRFDETELAQVMRLANEQAEWNGRTRDLIARTSPAPIGVADAIPATMIPQWHRGSEWGRDAARRLHDEVAAKVTAGEGVVEDEQARLMWIGRGLWFDMGFYQHFQHEYGAVFVWSMYLAVAADAYLRRGTDPIRTLAGRFCGFADLYNTPPWSSEWYAKEALHHQIDGVVHLTGDAVRGSHFITRAIEAAGIPVLEIEGSNVDSRQWDAGSVVESVAGFLEARALPHAARRRFGTTQ